MRLARLPRSRSLAATLVLVAALASLLAGCSLPFGDSSSTSPQLPNATPTPRPPTPEEIAAQMVSKMSLEDKLGQMIIMQFYEPTYTPAQKIVEATGTLYFKFGDLDSTKPTGGIKIRVETISHYLGKYSQEIIRRKLTYLSPNCPLTDLPATASPAGVASGVSEGEQVAISVV